MAMHESPDASSGDQPPGPIPVTPDVLAAVASGSYYSPHSVLGPHLDGSWATVRVLRPLAESVSIITPEGRHPAAHEQDGIWQAVVPAFVDEDGTHAPDYTVAAVYDAQEIVADDPYRFLPTVTDYDLYLIGEGRHEELWTVLGAHLRSYASAHGEVRGASFAVWAPGARAVRVVGDMNFWDGQAHAMRELGSSGVWEIFIPGVEPGTRYKYEILTQDGHWIQKADPLARRTQVPPETASVVDDSAYEWGDDAWVGARSDFQPVPRPMSTYEVHLGSWKPGLSYAELAEQLPSYVKSMGFTHVELMPVAEHPFGGSWGYQVSGYYAPTARFGTPDEFRGLVDALHQAGIGVLLDWVPAHFPKDAFALARFDGTPLYEDPDPQRGEQPDWDTYVFAYGRREVRNFLVANACYWLEEFHIDGLRVDAVASMLYLDYSRGPGQWHPNRFGGRENLEAVEFLQEVNATAYRRNPGIVMIAEESTAWPGVTRPTSAKGLGFGLKWNMGWMNDTLRYLAEEPINRRYHHHELTFSLVYAYSENYVLPLSHDEVVHGKGSLLHKMPGDRWKQFAGVRALLAYQWTHPGKKLIFMGDELAQDGEWNADTGVEWDALRYDDHRGVRTLVHDLNAFYVRRPPLWELDQDQAGFEWIDSNDADHNTLTYLRRDTQGHVIVVAVNFAGAAFEHYRVGVPSGGYWTEAVNTDAEAYGGSGLGNLGRVRAEAIEHCGRPYSLDIVLPALAAVIFEPEDETPQG